MSSPSPAPRKNPSGSARQFALAMELPFLLVGGALVGGLLGFFLDRWLHSKPFLMLILGGLGFIASVRDMLRRLQKDDSDSSGNAGK
jgi:F0F1-type ATP synthase assembly protein I